MLFIKLVGGKVRVELGENNPQGRKHALTILSVRSQTKDSNCLSKPLHSLTFAEIICVFQFLHIEYIEYLQKDACLIFIE